MLQECKCLLHFQYLIVHLFFPLVFRFRGGSSNKKKLNNLKTRLTRPRTLSALRGRKPQQQQQQSEPDRVVVDREPQVSVSVSTSVSEGRRVSRIINSNLNRDGINLFLFPFRRRSLRRSLAASASPPSSGPAASSQPQSRRRPKRR